MSAGTVATAFSNEYRSSFLRLFCPTEYWSRPSLLLEQRAGYELAQLFASPVFYGTGIPFGGGSPVLLVPGFLGSDSYMSVLAGWLRRTGHDPYYSGIALNAGRTTELLGRVVAQAEHIVEQRRQPLTIIGHSLGGLYAAVLARYRPDLVRHVITLGSPVAAHPLAAAHPVVAAFGEVLLHDNGGATTTGATPPLDLIAQPLPDGIAMTCVYTREDAVVDWRACIDPHPCAIAHEVSGTHLGLAWNTKVFQFLARRLVAV